MILQTVNDQILFYRDNHKVKVKATISDISEAIRQLFKYNHKTILIFIDSTSYKKLESEKLEYFLDNPLNLSTNIDEFGRVGHIMGVNIITDKNCLYKYIDGCQMVTSDRKVELK